MTDSLFPELSFDEENPKRTYGKSDATKEVEEQSEMPFMGEVTNPVTPDVSVSMLEAEAAKALEEEEPSLEDLPLPPQSGGAQVKLQLFGRPDEDLAQMTKLHLHKMEGNPYFPSPMPSQSELNTLLDTFVQDCRDTRNAMNHVRMLVAQKLRSRRRLEQALNRRGNYVQLASRGDAEAILSTSFAIRRKRQSVSELEAPTEVQAVPGETTGSMILTWSKVKHAKLYRLEYGPVDGPLVEIPLTGRRRKELTGLVVGRLHRFRIAAIGGATGQSPWSAVVERMVA